MVESEVPRTNNNFSGVVPDDDTVDFNPVWEIATSVEPTRPPTGEGYCADLLAASANPPQVTLDMPNGAGPYSVDLEVSWTGTDLNSDKLFCNLYYQPATDGAWYQVATTGSTKPLTTQVALSADAIQTTFRRSIWINSGYAIYDCQS